MKKELVFRKDKTIFQENIFPDKDFRPPENVGRYKLSHSRPDRQATCHFPNNLHIQFPTARNDKQKAPFYLHESTAFHLTKQCISFINAPSIVFPQIISDIRFLFVTFAFYYNIP